MRPDEFGAFYVHTVELDGQAELRLVGELDMDTADRPAQALEPVYDHGVVRLVLDLSELKFIDASGLNQLVKALKRQRECGWPRCAPRAQRPDAAGP